MQGMFINILEGRNKIQNYIARLEIWVGNNTFNNVKNEVFHLGTEKQRTDSTSNIYDLIKVLQKQILGY